MQDFSMRAAIAAVSMAVICAASPAVTAAAADPILQTEFEDARLEQENPRYVVNRGSAKSASTNEGASVEGAFSNASEIPLSVQQAVIQNTQNPSPVTGTGTILEDGAVISSEELDISVSMGGHNEGELQESVDIIERSDGMQLVTTLTAESSGEIRFYSPGKKFELLETGYVLVFNEYDTDPEYIVDPAWAEDGQGNSVDTGYRIEGDTLIQDVAIPENDPDVRVFADPYYRNSMVWGNYPTSDLIFTRSETLKIGGVGGLCATVISGLPVRAACGALAAAATFATADNKCLGERKVFLPGTHPALLTHRSGAEIAYWPMSFPC